MFILHQELDYKSVSSSSPTDADNVHAQYKKVSGQKVMHVKGCMSKVTDP